MHTAREYLARKVDAVRRAGEDRLPAIAHLARNAGVSTVTMWKAVRELADAGTLVARPRRGIELTGEPLRRLGRNRLLPDTSHRWQKVSERLASDITSDRYLSRPTLPSTKELSGRYGVSSRTMRKALAALEAQGLLEHDLRRWRVRPLSMPAGRGVVGVIARVSEDTQTCAVGEGRAAEMRRAVESECSRLGLQMRALSYGFWDGCTFNAPSWLRRPARTVNDLGPMLGYVVLSLAIPDEHCHVLVRALTRTGSPVVLLDETGVTESLGGERGPGPFRLYQFSRTAQCGRDVGRYLLRTGHRRVAYICPYHRGVWTRSRVDGVRQVFAEAGYGEAVSLYADETEPYSATLSAQQSEIVNAHELFVHSRPGDKPVARLYRDAIRDLLPDILTNHIENTMRGQCFSLFEQALRNKTLTAWVGSNDRVALAAQHFLGSRGIPVPDRISAIGFDDSINAFGRGLTSYNFNVHGVAHAMLSFVTDPGRPPRGAGPMEVEGFVNERGSSRGGRG